MAAEPGVEGASARCLRHGRNIFELELPLSQEAGPLSRRGLLSVSLPNRDGCGERGTGSVAMHTNLSAHGEKRDAALKCEHPQRVGMMSRRL